MGLYLYCVTRRDNPPGLTLAGVCGGEIRSLELAGFSVWVEAAAERPAPSLESVRDHHRVVEQGAEGGPVLPLRFGQWVADVGDVEAALERRREAYEDALDRVEGAVEVGVRIQDRDARPSVEPAAEVAGTGPGGEPPPGGKGRAYLEALREREHERDRSRRRGEELARELAADLGPLLRGEWIDTPEAGGDLVTLAHLVAREDLGRHAEEVRALRERHPELRIVSSGPWPPYSFTPREKDDDETTERDEP